MKHPGNILRAPFKFFKTLETNCKKQKNLEKQFKPLKLA